MYTNILLFQFKIWSNLSKHVYRHWIRTHTKMKLSKISNITKFCHFVFWSEKKYSIWMVIFIVLEFTSLDETKRCALKWSISTSKHKIWCYLLSIVHTQPIPKSWKSLLSLLLCFLFVVVVCFFVSLFFVFWYLRCVVHAY